MSFGPTRLPAQCQVNALTGQVAMTPRKSGSSNPSDGFSLGVAQCEALVAFG
jgi:hypothetical protein